MIYRKENPWTLAVGIEIGAATIKNYIEVSQKIELSYDQAIPLLGIQRKQKH